MSLRKRIEDPTPRWFKKIIRIALMLSAAGAAVLAADATIPKLHLSAFIESAAQYMVVGGLVAAAVSKTARENVMPVILIIAVLCLSSCSRHTLPQITQSDVIKDSSNTNTEYKKKDSTISRPADTVRLHDTLPCPGVDYHKEVTSTSGRTKATVDLRNGNLSVECNADSLQARIEWLEGHTTTEKFRTETKTVTVTVTQKVKVVPWWCWLIGILFVGYLGVKLYLRITSTPKLF